MKWTEFAVLLAATCSSGGDRLLHTRPHHETSGLSSSASKIQVPLRPFADGAHSCFARDETVTCVGETSFILRAPTGHLARQVHYFVSERRVFVLSQKGALFVSGDVRTGRRYLEPFEPTRDRSVLDMAVGLAHLCVLTPLHRVACSGRNGWGQLGDGVNAHSTAFTEVDLPGVLEIVASANATCARTSDRVHCWGKLYDLAQRVPREVMINQRPLELAVGDGFFCARLSDGTVSCWGIGLSMGGTHWTGSAIPGLDNVEQLAVSLVAICGIDGDNQLYCVPGPTTSNNAEGLLATDVDAAWAMGSDVCWVVDSRTACTDFSPRTAVLIAR